MSRAVAFAVVIAVAAISASCSDGGGDPAAAHRRLVAAAEQEGALVIYSTTDRSEAAALLKRFHKLYPGVQVDYRDLLSRTIFTTVIAEAKAHKQGADLVWSAAMDLQTKLVNDGYAQAYVSPQKRFLPAWAIWKDQAWGTTAEPIVFVYNRKLMPPADVPRTRAALTRLLRAKADFYRGRIATYDPYGSSSGYLFISQDAQISRDTIPLMEAMGSARVRLFDQTTGILDSLASGESLIAYNVFGSYALERLHRDDRIGVVMPADYTLVTSRIALILKDSAHPNAARLFLDFLLSKEGQSALARQYMTPVRDDVSAPPDARAPVAVARAIRISPALVANVDALKRRRFLNRWDQALASGTRHSGAQGKDAEHQTND